MASVSSTSSTRRLGGTSESIGGGIFRTCNFKRNFQRECRSLAGTIAANRQAASQFRGQIGSAVQPEAMPFAAGRKALRKDSRQVLGRDPDPVVDDFDPSLVFG